MERCCWNIVKSDHRDILRHTMSGVQEGFEDRHRHLVVEADDRRTPVAGHGKDALHIEQM